MTSGCFRLIDARVLNDVVSAVSNIEVGPTTTITYLCSVGFVCITG